jgi:hypothetical protein
MKPIQVLLSGAIDYAGLFPPAALPLPAAMANHAAYRSGPDSWALGRFIVPASRLPELEPALPRASGWRLSVLAGSDIAADLERVAAFNDRHTGGAGTVIDAIELKADSVRVIRDTLRQVPDQLQVYVEVPIEQEPAELIAALHAAQGRAKVRTGGVTPDAFPSTAKLAGFLSTCVRAGVPFKATAGLHHALRGDYPHTYAIDSSRGSMFGFLNLFLATALLEAGGDRSSTSRMLEESSPGSLQVDEWSIRWNDWSLDLELLRRARERMVSFGSCSFTEPLAELRSLQLLGSEVRQA